MAPAERSDAALEKVFTKRLEDGSEAHSFRTLLGHLSTVVRNTCRGKDTDDNNPTFEMDTIPGPKQQKAYDLLETIQV